MGGGFIDLHFHILPDVDDGAKNLEMALAMARLALADGVNQIVATPHPDPQTGIGSRLVTDQAVADFNASLVANGLGDLQILTGTECYLVPELAELLKNQNLITLNYSRYVLIEFPTVLAPVNIENAMFGLRSAGYIPIIAHPERYNYVQEDAEWLARLVRLGCLTQVTAGAFYGRFGKRCQKSAEDLVRYGLTHVLASDAHNLKVRAPGLTPAQTVVDNLGGVGFFQQCVVDVPAKILANTVYSPSIPENIGGRSWWKFW